MSKVSIIGAGYVGSTVAHWAMIAGGCQLVLLDVVDGLAKGKVLVNTTTVRLERGESSQLVGKLPKTTVHQGVRGAREAGKREKSLTPYRQGGVDLRGWVVKREERPPPPPQDAHREYGQFPTPSGISGQKYRIH